MNKKIGGNITKSTKFLGYLIYSVKNINQP